ncbi:MAG: D-glycero-alpha-D-manno-heptose-1,7-bisphosphate 7-phosphatase [Armatimonadaceae bacterium]
MTTPVRIAFLDRDGVINQYLPGEYVRTPDELVILPGVVDAIKALKNAGWQVAMVTNQQGIGKGLMTPADLDAVHAKLHAALESAGTQLHAVRVCPHLASDACACRKPKPGMILDIAADLGADVRNAVFFGDTDSDAAAARAAGVAAFHLILGGKRTAEDALQTKYFPTPPDGIYPDLLSAVTSLLQISNR